MIITAKDGGNVLEPWLFVVVGVFFMQKTLFRNLHSWILSFAPTVYWVYTYVIICMYIIAYIIYNECVYVYTYIYIYVVHSNDLFESCLRALKAANSGRSKVATNHYMVCCHNDARLFFFLCLLRSEVKGVVLHLPKLAF